MEAIGQFRSYIRHDGKKNHLLLFVFVQEIHFMEEFVDYTKDNQIYLEGYICKEPIYRKTPLGCETTGSVDSCEPSLWEIGLYPLHMLVAHCPFCFVP